MLLSKFRGILLSGVSLFAVLLTPVLFAEEEESVSSDRLLPPGVLLHVRLSDISDLKERLPKTGFGQMYQDESMAKIRSQVEKGFEKASKDAGKELGFPLSDLLNLPTGEASFALLLPAGRELAGVAIMEIDEQQETLDKALAKLDEALSSKGAKKKSETVEDVEVTVYETPKDEDSESADSPKNTLCYFTKDGLFVAGTDLSVLQDVLTRWDGESEDVLAEQEIYSYIHSKCATREDDDSVMEWYVDPVGLVTAALNANEEQAFQAMMFATYLPTVGLDKFKGVGGSIDLAEDGYDMHSKSFVYVEQPTSGVLRAFEFPATDLTPPAWVGADVPQYLAVNWDAAGAYTALVEMADTIQNQPGASEQAIGKASKELGFNVKTDLIDLLDGQVVMLNDVNSESEKVQQRLLVAVKLKDSTKFQETLNAILEKAGSSVTERDFEGTKVYDIQSPDPNMSPALSISKDHLFVSTHADMLEAALRPSSRDDETLAESEDFIEVKKLMPSKNSMISFSDMGAQLKPSYDMLKKGQLDGVTEGQFDFSVLPDFEKIEKFFSISGSYTIPDEKGVYSESFLFGTDE